MLLEQLVQVLPLELLPVQNLSWARTTSITTDDRLRVSYCTFLNLNPNTLPLTGEGISFLQICRFVLNKISSSLNCIPDFNVDLRFRLLRYLLTDIRYFKLKAMLCTIPSLFYKTPQRAHSCERLFRMKIVELGSLLFANLASIYASICNQSFSLDQMGRLWPGAATRPIELLS